MEEEYSLEITPNAMKFIRTHIIPENLTKSHGLVMYSPSPTGGSYTIQASPLVKLNAIRYYTQLFTAEYHQHGFEIFVERMLLTQHYLPNQLVLDVMKNSMGEMVLEVKNPAFE